MIHDIPVHIRFCSRFSIFYMGIYNFICGLRDYNHFQSGPPTKTFEFGHHCYILYLIGAKIYIYVYVYCQLSDGGGGDLLSEGVSCVVCCNFKLIGHTFKIPDASIIKKLKNIP